jgi:hypothetical protein
LRNKIRLPAAMLLAPPNQQEALKVPVAQARVVKARVEASSRRPSP